MLFCCWRRSANDEQMDWKSRSSVLCAAIDEADTKRRRPEASLVLFSRIGMFESRATWGVRVEKATHQAWLRW